MEIISDSDKLTFRKRKPRIDSKKKKINNGEELEENLLDSSYNLSKKLTKKNSTPTHCTLEAFAKKRVTPNKIQNTLYIPVSQNENMEIVDKKQEENEIMVQNCMNFPVTNSTINPTTITKLTNPVSIPKINDVFSILHLPRPNT